MGEVSHRIACPKCRQRGGDNRGDNLVVYKDGSSFCYSCGFCKASEGPYNTGEMTTMDNRTLVDILKKRSIDSEVIKDYGVTLQEHDGFYHVAFPIKDNTLDTYVWHLRTVDMTNASLTRDMKYYPPKQKLTVPLFGIDQVKQNVNTILIVEGETDALIAASRLKGQKNVAVVGMLGVTMAKRAAKYVARFWDKRKIILCFDNDEPGKEAVDNFTSTYSQHTQDKLFRLRVPSQYKDLGDWLVSDESPQDFNETLSLASPMLSSNILNSQDIADSLDDYLRRTMQRETLELRFSPRLSRCVSIEPGKMVGILGSASQGKSTLAEHIILEAVTQKKRVFVLSAEMSAAELALKLMRTIRRAPLHDPEYLRKLPAEDLYTIKSDTARLLSWLSAVDDFGACSLDTLEEYLLELGSYGQAPDLVVIDHLLAISSDLDKDTLQDTCKRLKGIARKYNTCVLLLSHTRKSQNQSKRTIFRPSLDDAYGSSGLANYSDCVVAVAKDEVNKQTLVEVVKMERIGGKYDDITLSFEDFRLQELDKANKSALEYEQETEEIEEEFF